MGLTRQEQEVVIRWSATDKLVSIYDYRDATADTLEAAGYGSGKESRMKGDQGKWEVVARMWTGIPLSAIRVHADGSIQVRARRVRKPKAAEGGEMAAPPHWANVRRKNGKTGQVRLAVDDAPQA